MKHYGDLVTKWPFKVVVLLVTLALIGLSIWSCTLLEGEYNAENYIPSGSYLKATYNKYETYFQQEIGTFVYTVTLQFDYHDYREGIVQLQNNVSDNEYVAEAYPAWYSVYSAWLPIASAGAYDPATIGEFDFYCTLASFVEKSETGQRFNRDIVWENETIANMAPEDISTGDNCTAISNISATRLGAQTKPLNDNDDLAIDAMNSLRNTVLQAPFDAFSYAGQYIFWYTSEQLPRELGVNLGLALAFTLVVLLIFLQHPFMVAACWFMVALTILLVAGSLRMWGLQIEVVTVINLVLAIGLSVDYSVHIAFSYLTETSDDREERVKNVLAKTGVSVFNGGFTTFLALVWLVGADSWVFRVFFYMFATTVVVGVFFGLVVLPVILATIAPTPNFAKNLTLEELTGEKGAGEEGEKEAGEEGEKEVGAVQMEEIKVDKEKPKEEESV